MPEYKVKVTETVIKWFSVEAENEELAYEIAAQEYIYDIEDDTPEHYSLDIEVHGEGSW